MDSGVSRVFPAPQGHPHGKINQTGPNPSPGNASPRTTPMLLAPPARTEGKARSGKHRLACPIRRNSSRSSAWPWPDFHRPCRQLEASLFISRINGALADPRASLDNQLSQELEKVPGQIRGYLLTKGFRRASEPPKAMTPGVSSFATRPRASAIIAGALEEFERLKALRNELPNEPVAEAQPEENSARVVPQSEPNSVPRSPPPLPSRNPPLPLC
jgi:hypothetical protein